MHAGYAKYREPLLRAGVQLYELKSFGERRGAGLPRDAYEVRLNGDSLEWIDGQHRHTSEPGTGLLKRLWVGVLSLLPIEWLL